MKKVVTPQEKARGERIAYLRKEVLGLPKQEALLNLMGVKLSRGAVGNWELGGAIGHRNLALIAKVSGASVEWIEAGLGRKPDRKERGDLVRVPIGQEFQSESDDLALRNVSVNAAYDGVLLNAIPDVDVRAGAGSGGYSMAIEKGGMLAGDVVRGEMVLPDYVLSDFTPAAAPMIHSVEVRGDSMDPTLTSGDRVLVDTTDKAIGQGGVFVFYDSRHNETNVKRLRRTGAGEELRIEIISDNPKQGAPDFVISPEIIVIGRAVARLSRI